MHADEIALRRAVCAAPDDDLPRLVFADYLEERADYLEERGDTRRAQFIRLQCEQARELWGTARWRELRRLAGRTRPSAEAWAEHIGDRAERGEFVRGFVGRVTVTAAAFADRGGELFDREPVRSAAVWCRPGEVERALACSHLARVRDLEIVGETSPGDLLRITAAGAGVLAGLAGLTLGMASFDWSPAAVVDLLTALPRLTRLGRGGGGWGVNHLRGLVASPAFARVTDLGVTGGADALDVLAGGSHTGGLRRLWLNTRADELGRLAGADALAGVEVLELAQPFLPYNPRRPRAEQWAAVERALARMAAAPFASTLKVAAVPYEPLDVLDALRAAFPAADVYVR